MNLFAGFAFSVAFFALVLAILYGDTPQYWLTNDDDCARRRTRTFLHRFRTAASNRKDL